MTSENGKFRRKKRGQLVIFLSHLEMWAENDKNDFCFFPGTMVTVSRQELVDCVPKHYFRPRVSTDAFWYVLTNGIAFHSQYPLNNTSPGKHFSLISQEKSTYDQSIFLSQNNIKTTDLYV